MSTDLSDRWADFIFPTMRTLRFRTDVIPLVVPIAGDLLSSRLSSFSLTSLEISLYFCVGVVDEVGLVGEVGVVGSTPLLTTALAAVLEAVLLRDMTAVLTAALFGL